MPSPPKPWEVNNGGSTAAATSAVTSTLGSTDTSLTSSTPAVPDRPSTMATTSGYGGVGGYGSSMGGYGSTLGGYGSTMGGYGSSYSSPYSRMGGYGGYGSSYGGYGGYGSSYGGYGGYGGYSRFGGGMYNRYGGGMGGMGGMGDEFGMQQGGLESSTRATFEIIDQIVGAFGGFAQMLDSTYMATHSSFMAMVGVAEQFGNLRHYLGNLFNVYSWIRWFKRIIYRLTGREIPPELYDPQPENPQQRQIEGNAEGAEHSQQQQQPVRRKRSVLFMMAIFLGLPYMLYKLFQRAREYHRNQMLLQGREEVATAMYDFVAEAPMELNLRRGDTVYIMSKVDPASGAPSDWWQGRLANGTTGIFPANYVVVQPAADLSRKMR
ncbi:Peroxin 13, N-terminal region-domain-containing protein [Fennellomyces sp. T-0311]|nr:Peroxin 13, N-terminal region-domain-containing protein [Fennellomyces sp. T-0311]